MSINFGSNNLFIVPEGKTLNIYDLYNWRILHLDAHNIFVYLQSDYLNILKNNIESAYKKFNKLEKDKENLIKVKKELKDFFGNIKRLSPGLDSALNFKDLFIPQEISMWVRISDCPMESFDKEDYPSIKFTEKKTKDDFNFAVSLPGAFHFAGMGNYEAALPWDEGKEGFYLKMHENILSVEDIDPLVLLPITEEYIGVNGISVLGNSANYDSKGKITSENLLCIPLNKNKNNFSTLYFQIITDIKHIIYIRLSEKESDTAIMKLNKHGYKDIISDKDNYILKKEKNVLHFYNNCPGKENEGSRFLSPFILIVMADGKTNPEKRTELFKELNNILKYN